MDEQAESALGTLDDLASYLDTPETESAEDIEATDADESTDELDTETEANDEQDDESESTDDEEEPAPVEKITVKVKGEDGAEETLELTQEEVAASYLRQRDYTRKTQELAKRESEAVEFLTQKHEEIRSQYLSQAELTRAAIVQMAGIKSESEMAELANSDPAAWVAETNRQRQISAYLNQLNQQIEGEKSASEKAAEQRLAQTRQKQFSESWEVLSKEGIDKPKLQKIYGDISAKYGITDSELATVYDARMVKIMRDAVAYQALKDKKPEVTKKVQNAPRLPSKQTPPAQERRSRELDNRFKSGRAKLSDLAAFLR